MLSLVGRMICRIACLFRLDRIGNFTPDPRETFTEIRPNFNPDDKGMVGSKVCIKIEN